MSVTELTHRISGDVIAPDDEAYRAFAELYAPGLPPSMIVRSQSAADVGVAVRYAASRGIAVSVRSGGHAGATFATEPSLLIDLSAFTDVEIVDADRGLVSVGGGATWGQVANELRPHGLAISSGDTTTVGVGGLTLGGGVGWMVRGHGLAIDSLVEAEVVTAGGDIVTASEQHEPELFWALRGGGGNFGVVTRFTFRAQRLPGVVAGAITFGGDVDLEALLRGWRDVMREAPEELNVTFLAMPAFGPEMPAAVQLLCCYAGDDEDAAMQALAPLLDLDGVIGDDLVPKAYADVLDEPPEPPGPVTAILNNSFASEFSDELIGSLVAAHRGMGAAVLMIRSLAGAFNRVSPDDTAFAMRDSEVLLISMAILPPDAPAEAVGGVQQTWETLAPLTSGSYVNFIDSTGSAGLTHAYPPATLERLARVKRRYDPQNLFRCNHNIAPA